MKTINIEQVSVPLVRAKMTFPLFEKWCESHGWTGNLLNKYNEIRKEAGLPTEHVEVEIKQPKKKSKG